MKKYLVLLAIVPIVFMTSGCIQGPMVTVGYLQTKLFEVEKPKDVKERYGQKEKIFIEDEKYAYEDNLIKILFLPMENGINFWAYNKTDYSIKVIWDEAAYLDTKGISHRVIHSGVKYTNKDQPQAPGIIVAGGRLEDVMFPSDWVSWGYNKWNKSKMGIIVKSSSESKDAFRRRCDNWIGEKLSVLLPLKVEDVTNEYTFIFIITGVEIEERPVFSLY